ncbi:Mitochondrial Rho GTPase 1 [Yarrowia sp. C11]|nr:Mitochondrial Rho GTPase 1 [Yarrowia sp. C11]KAG5364759.1 Mitochondrial Rho GTPase 1 [Yarrowia sp. E02]
MTNDVIRIVVCGDEGVGKSSLITSLIKDTYVPNIQKLLPPITIPKGFSSSPDAPLSTVIVDTQFSNSPADAEHLHREIRQAHVIWLVYSDHYSCERVSIFWLPYFRNLGVNLPIVLCANVFDEVDSWNSRDSERIISDEMIPILREFKEIESCIRVSAKLNHNINQAFYLCQKAVMHPIAPLFDAKEGKLKPNAVAALQRVFFLSDRDQDGFLSDQEMLELQVKCFGRSFDATDLMQIRAQLAKINPDLASERGVSEEGFIVLNRLYADKGRHETTWGILRTFHYTDYLSLSDQFLYPHLDVPENSSVELSPEGYRFLVDLFLLFDKDNDGGLNDSELKTLFKPTPGIPQKWLDFNFPYTTVHDEQGSITLQGWLALWSMTTFLDYKTTMAYLAYLGFEGDNSKKRFGSSVTVAMTTAAAAAARLTAFKVTKPKKRRSRPRPYYRATPNDRSVFNCFVLGSHMSGKTSLLEAFLSRPLMTDVYKPTIRPVSVVNSVEMTGGKQCYMVMEELGQQEAAVLSNAARLEECDVICYTYDSSDPNSFSYIDGLRTKYPLLDTLPCVFVALKADNDRQQQRFDLQPDEYTKQIRIAAPLHVSSKWPSSVTELFVQLAEAAQQPGRGLPNQDPEEETNTIMPFALAGGATVLLAAAVAWIFKNVRVAGRE